MFTVSIRKDIYNGFFFPAPIKLEKRLKDMLEDEVDDKYYLSDEQVANMKATNFNAAKIETRVQNGGGVSGTLLARDYKDPKCIQVAQLYGFGKEPNPQAGRVYSQAGLCPTMDTMSGGNREPKIVAQRGRAYRGEPQHLEMRRDSLTNTITSVQKDNYVVESGGGTDSRRHIQE